MPINYLIPGIGYQPQHPPEMQLNYFEIANLPFASYFARQLIFRERNSITFKDIEINDISPRATQQNVCLRGPPCSISHLTSQ